jgi:predicted small metal-binding protein
MAKTVTCACGHVVNAVDEDDFVAQVTEHAEAVHPEMASGLTREAILSMAQDA